MNKNGAHKDSKAINIERKVLILGWMWDEFTRGQIDCVADMLDCKTPYEFLTFEEFRNRWGSYDWESPAFHKVILRRYRKICVHANLVTAEVREMIERLRPIYEAKRID